MPFTSLALPDIYNSPATYNKPYNLRGNGNIQLSYTRTESYKGLFILDALHRWNLLDINTKTIQNIENFKQIIKKPTYPKQEIFYNECRWASVRHARIRPGCSKLNRHLCHSLHVLRSAMCKCGIQEDPIHFFFTCPLHAIHRITQPNTVAPLANAILWHVKSIT